MGKASVLMGFVALFAGGSLLYQTVRDEVTADTQRAAAGELAVAQEIARSAHDMMLYHARQRRTKDRSLSTHALITAVNGPSGKLARPHQKGSYEAWLEQTSPSTVVAVAVGRFRNTAQRLRTQSVDGSVGGPALPDVLRVDEPSHLEVTFLRSDAGYCAGVYLERILPNVPVTEQPEPELLFAPGNRRDGAAVRSTAPLDPGTRVNLLLAVDADYNCEKRNVAVPITHWTYEYVRPALVGNPEDPIALQEGKYALIEGGPGAAPRWRVAFEDLIFSDAKLADVKRRGYGSTNWSRRTYGGSGWSETDSTGYFRLREYSHMPDFSDQVLEVRLTPVTTLARR